MITSEYRYSKHVYPKSLKRYEFKDSNLLLVTEDNKKNEINIEYSFYQNGIIGVRVLNDDCFKLEYDFINSEYRDFEKSTILEDNETEIKILYLGYEVIINKQPYCMTILKDRHIVLSDSIDDVNPVGDGENIIAPLGYTCSGGDEILGSNIGFKLHQDENIYGLGEQFTEFNKRGQQVLMQNKDTLGCRNNEAYKNIPFYVSTYQYGLFVNSHLMSEFNIGYESLSTISIHVPDSKVEYFILLGQSMKEIVGKYTNLTGPAAMPPRWSFGLWYSTGFKDASRKTIESDAAFFRKNKIPCDVMHFDCYWLRDDMWCDFVWNDAMYPNRVEMLTQLKDMGYKVCLWINPYVTIKTEMYEEGKKEGYFVKDSSGKPYLADLWHGLLSMCALVDFTNNNAVEWFKDKVSSLLVEGVDLVKTDFGENIPLDSCFFNGEDGEKMRNIYSLLYNKAVFEVTKKLKGKENAIVWGRSGFAGMQKYPVCWSGDPRSSFEGMAATLKAGLSIGFSGVPFWSHDIGGFYGEVSDDVFVRWAQFGLFSSHSRLHGTTTRQPWAYSERAMNIVSEFIKLRYKLMPYIYKTAQNCVEKGHPFIRPLVFENEDDPMVAHICDEYYFGEDIIVAPIFGGDNATRNVYLPKGMWRDMLKGNVYEGNQWIEVKAKLEYMPIFAKTDVVIEMSDSDIQFIEKEKINAIKRAVNVSH